MKKELLIKLANIQQTLKAPKNQKNTFGKYNYRSCEDILEAVKPLLGDLVLDLSDEIVEVGNRVYVKATATLSLGDITYSVKAYAREAETKKGMDDAQITGAASSYARKYALNGLFLIDDTKDADATNDHKVTKQVKNDPTPSQSPKEKPQMTDNEKNMVLGMISSKLPLEKIRQQVGKYEVSDEMMDEIKKAVDTRQKALEEAKKDLM